MQESITRCKTARLHKLQQMCLTFNFLNHCQGVADFEKEAKINSKYQIMSHLFKIKIP